MSIKGTLESFNLCELLQMLAFNQKEGTLVLETEGEGRTLFLDSGRLTVFERDAETSASFLRLARFHEVGDEQQLAAAAERVAAEGRSAYAILLDMGLTDEQQGQAIQRDAVLEQLFECQLTAVAGFEFVEGRSLLPDGSEDRPVLPAIPVDSLLLDLARMLDHWNTVASVVPGPGEVYEGTGIALDLAEQSEVDDELAALIIPLIDGRRSLAQIAEATHTTPHAVMEVAAALYEGGAIRAVPTEDLVRRAEDLLARGEAAATVALFQRCIDRGDADLQVRLRLADALEACGRSEAAAAELDTYAALADPDDAPAVFEALARALRLRGGDLATAARTCDFYLRRRPWLQEYRTLAEQALRDLITAATTENRPNDAALRLQGFIDVGDAPPEDRVLLSDLYAAGGARKEAADALYQRAEDLLATDRTAPARQLLRKALELDPGHADARRRQSEIEGVRRRRGHRARIAMILLALGSVASAAGVAWFGYRDTASTELTDAQREAESGFGEAETRALALVEAFAKRADIVEQGGLKDAELETAAKTMRENVRAIMASVTSVLSTYAAAIDEAQAAGKAGVHRENLDRLERRSKGATKQAAQVIDELADRARVALTAAHEHHTRGRFEAAGRHLRAAWSLSFDEDAVRADAARKLTIVDEYTARCASARETMARLTAADDLRGAFATGLAALEELLDSDLTRKLPFPVRVTSVPEGAAVWLGDEDTGQRTPCVLHYSPFAPEPVLRLRMGGRTTASLPLPSYHQVRRDPARVRAFDPHVHATLPEGPRWTIRDAEGRFHALWAGRGMPLVAGGRGHVRYAVATRDGELTRLGSADSVRDGIRMAGRFGDGTEWEVTGHRTLTVRPPRGDAWEHLTVGRIEYAPIRVENRLVLVDQIGTVYALRVVEGTPAWKVELGAPPTQRVQHGKQGLLVGTVRGGAFRIDPGTGDWADLAPAARGPAVVLPLGEGVALIGGGKDGCRVLDAKGDVASLGDAQPEPGRAAYVDADGVAWIDRDGRVRWLARGAEAPVLVQGLGTRVERLGGGGGMLFGAGADGRMRAVRLTTPSETAWSAPMGGRADSAPLRLDRGVYVLVEGRLVAFDT